MGVLAVIGIEGGPSTPTSRLEGSVQVSAEGSFDQALIDRIVFGRWWIPDTYHLAIAAVVLVFALEHWTRDFRWTPGAKGDGQCRWRKGSAPSESSPLLESLEQKTGLARHGRLRLLRLRLRAVLTYQPRPIPFVNKILPSNATSLLVLLLLGINIFYLNYYTGSTLAVWTACILDRAGLLFVANLPWLYLLAAKNQPLRLLTGHSYESLNILHRRLGEWMCLLAVFHVMGFFAFWWYYASPVAEDPLAVLVGWLLQGFVLIGIGAFVCYEALWATSLASFRQWWYECFLASHVVLQAAGLVLVFLHHPNARNDALVALAIFVVDRGVYRATSKSRTLKASVIVLDDGETILLSADWPLTRQASLWRRVLGKNIKSGWKPLEHVFITAPDLGRGHSLQAHPFTIASAAPERNQEHAWLSLIIRARDGFTRDLLRHARSLPTLSIRFDGPYGSQDAVEMLRQSHTAILVAGGSGIAVAYPVIWSLLHDVKAESACGRSKRAALVWIVREASHISWIGKERLDELRELGLHLVLPEPTTNAGRPDVQRLLLEAMEDTASGSVGENIGVVVSAPDAMNREVNTTCARLAWGGRDVRVAVEKFGW